MALLTKGQRVGTIRVMTTAGAPVAEVPLVVLEAVPQSGLMGRAWDSCVSGSNERGAMAEEKVPDRIPVQVPHQGDGAHVEGFVEAIAHVAPQFDPDFDHTTIEQRPSKGGNYLGLTITITATSREQLDELYRTHADHAPDGQGCAVIVKRLGQVEYLPTLDTMRCLHRRARRQHPDELWVCEHPATFTQGIAGKTEHLLDPGPIPVVQTERGGQVTFHGPGQIVVYPLIDLRRLNIFAKEYVFRLEAA